MTPRPPTARTLDDIAADDGIFSIIAMDQRNTLRRMFTAVGLDATDDDLRSAKADVAARADPAGQRPPVRPDLRRPGHHRGGRWPRPAACSSPPSRPSGGSFNGEPRTHRDPELERAAGCSTRAATRCKFFVQLRADRPAPRRRARPGRRVRSRPCREVIDDCRAVGVPVGHREPGVPAARART